jgi:hypothetical protein
MIGNQNNCSLNEIFSKENSIDNIIIKSPIESSKLAISNIKKWFNYNVKLQFNN